MAVNRPNMTALRILPYAIAASAAGVLVWALLRGRRDHARTRGAPGAPFLSVVIPTYNCRDTLPQAVECLFRSYPPAKIDLVIVDDASSDGTSEVLRRLRERYEFEVLAKSRNEGKARAVNDGVRKSRGEVVLILDADTAISRPILDDLLRRLSGPRIGAASSRYVVANRGFLPRMTGITYALLAIGQATQNARSCLSLWGGCMAFKRAALDTIGEFRARMLLEDMDAALRLSRGGWKVEQAWTAIETRVPARFGSWLRQQVRWASGMTQCILTFPRLQTRSLGLILKALLYWLVSAAALLAFLLPGTFGLSTALVLTVAFMLLSLPLAFASHPGAKWKSAPLVVAYALVFFPLHVTVAGFSFIIGIAEFFRLRRGGRAW